MKKAYLALAALGFVAPNIFATKVGMETGNYMLYTDPLTTINQMFANDIASTFIVDLLIACVVFFVWTFVESKRSGMKAPWVIWILTLLFGLSGTLPLFLYQRELAKEKGASN